MQTQVTGYAVVTQSVCAVQTQGDLTVPSWLALRIRRPGRVTALRGDWAAPIMGGWTQRNDPLGSSRS